MGPHSQAANRVGGEEEIPHLEKHLQETIFRGKVLELRTSAEEREGNEGYLAHQGGPTRSFIQKASTPRLLSGSHSTAQNSADPSG